MCENVWPQIWSSWSKKSQQKEIQHWAKSKAKARQSRKLTGIYYIDPTDKEFNETLKSARKKSELHMDSDVPCKISKDLQEFILEGA